MRKFTARISGYPSPLPEHQKGKEISAFNVIFVIKSDCKLIEVPANYCGTTVTSLFKKFLKKGKTVSRRFIHEDKICPKNVKKVLFLGPKPRPDGSIIYPQKHADIRFLNIGANYEIKDIKLVHALQF